MNSLFLTACCIFAVSIHSSHEYPSNRKLQSATTLNPLVLVPTASLGWFVITLTAIAFGVLFFFVGFCYFQGQEDPHALLHGEVASFKPPVLQKKRYPPKPVQGSSPQKAVAEKDIDIQSTESPPKTSGHNSMGSEQEPSLPSLNSVQSSGQPKSA
ncbi:hypothetical protein HDE_10424 [Halotydeus destructor]|nr:hypothetical protein HDE_10424 [Halotydeus destructor]